MDNFALIIVLGLVFSVTGYNDTIVISFTACAEQVPDPEVLAQCIRDSFQDYLALARQVLPSTSATPPLKRPGRRKTAGNAARRAKTTRAVSA